MTLFLSYQAVFSAVRGASLFILFSIKHTIVYTFNSNRHAGIIAHTREDAEMLFKRVKFAYDSLPSEIKALRVANTDNARELQLSNGSALRMGTSMRSNTLQYLHISKCTGSSIIQSPFSCGIRNAFFGADDFLNN